jgi:hypothetical protein
MLSRKLLIGKPERLRASAIGVAPEFNALYRRALQAVHAGLYRIRPAQLRLGTGRIAEIPDGKATFPEATPAK